MSVPMKTRQAYSEIDEFIGLLTVDEQKQIPKKLRDFFKEQKDKEYIKHINPNIPIKNQNLLEETLALIAMLNLQYWCKDEQERERLKNIYAENERKYQEKLGLKYNPNNIFNNKKKNVISEENNVNNEKMSNLPIEVKTEKFYNRLINFLKRLLHI